VYMLVNIHDEAVAEHCKLSQSCSDDDHDLHE